jgi:O-antigen ligase
MLLAGGLIVGYVLWDPGFEAAQRAAGSSLRYLSRGQDVAQIRAASGRLEMWSAIWNEYLASPIIGHGYFVTSRTGKLEVWNILANHTAHNIYLQVLATTGLVGMLIFALAMCGLAGRLSALRRGDLFARRFLWLIAFVSIWFFGWSLGCVSFVGPVRSESVVFFTLLGLAVGQLYRLGWCVPKPAGT